ncbi:MAG TPA: URC4/urg3 family protein [Methylomirabilota bacterium]|nr:URC4/urg3 family protein [Methylomirabilota bacterium]
MNAGRDAVAYLRTPEAVRDRAETVLARGLEGGLDHFRIEPARLPAVADLVAAVTRGRYPDLRVPLHSRWRHFGAGRVAELARALEGLPPDEQVRAKLDLTVTSVLLDAGAGPAWRYVEPGTGEEYRRSEGLAVASFRLFAAGLFSADPGAPWRADAQALAALEDDRLASGLQVSSSNPLPGLSGRAALLRQLGRALAEAPELFGKAEPRPGHLLDALREPAGDGLEAAEVLRAVLVGLGPIWPGRLVLDGVNLGDVWRHPAAGGAGPTAGLVPVHKLSQWLTYSLVEPLAEAGLRLTGLDRLTGLAEYRNGGLFLDLGVLVPRHEAVVRARHRPGDEPVVEWRALTVALLDRLAPLVRERLGAAGTALPLAGILEGGTWAAGRRLADERRNGAPPVHVDSDGTVM